jgi:PLP dependent protein
VRAGMNRDEIVDNYRRVQERLAGAALRAGRDPGEVTIVAVSKRQDAAAMRALQEHLAETGAVATFGESYVQEYQKKRPMLSAPCRAHLIGSLQRKKAAAAVDLFDLIETVDGAPLAEALNTAAARLGKLQEVLLQINISEDPAKHGCSPHAAGEVAAKFVRDYPNLRLRGLMTITRFYDEPEESRGDYRRMGELYRRLRQDAGQGEFELSMGMSADYEVAIEEGATLVRIGSALFGERPAL